MDRTEAKTASRAMTALAQPGYRIAYNSDKGRWHVYFSDGENEEFVGRADEMTQLAKYMYKAGVGKEALQLMKEDLEGGNDPLGLGI
jgi:hypothetical protein